MKICRLFAVLVCITISLPTAAQHIITLRGDTVMSVKIAEHNDYFDMRIREMVFPPEAWVEYSPFWYNSRILRERKAHRTKTTPIDSIAWLQLDSLLAEISVSRNATAADLGITDKMLKKGMRARWFDWSDRAYLHYIIPDQVTVDNLDQWLEAQYEKNKDTNCIRITTDASGFITVDVWLGGDKHKYFSLYRYDDELLYIWDGTNRYNLNTFRHLCALMPKTFDFSYKDFQKKIIYEFLKYLIEYNLSKP